MRLAAAAEAAVGDLRGITRNSHPAHQEVDELLPVLIERLDGIAVDIGSLTDLVGRYARITAPNRPAPAPEPTAPPSDYPTDQFTDWTATPPSAPADPLQGYQPSPAGPAPSHGAPAPASQPPAQMPVAHAETFVPSAPEAPAPEVANGSQAPGGVPASPSAQPAPEPTSEVPPAVPAAQPEAPSDPAARPVDPEPEPGASTPPVSDGIRLLATQMAVAGTSRREIARRLQGEFGVKDPDAALRTIFGSG